MHAGRVLRDEIAQHAPCQTRRSTPLTLRVAAPTNAPLTPANKPAPALLIFPTPLHICFLTHSPPAGVNSPHSTHPYLPLSLERPPADTCKHPSQSTYLSTPISTPTISSFRRPSNTNSATRMPLTASATHPYLSSFRSTGPLLDLLSLGRYASTSHPIEAVEYRVKGIYDAANLAERARVEKFHFVGGRARRSWGGIGGENSKVEVERQEGWGEQDVSWNSRLRSRRRH